MEQNEVILGVDTHLDAHVGAVISDTGRLLGMLSVSTDTTGYLDLLTWAHSFGQLRRPRVEGTGTYGADRPACCATMKSRCLKSIVPIAQCADPKGSKIPRMPKTPRVRSSPERLLLFQGHSPAPPKRCAPSPLPDAVQSRPGRRLSISYIATRAALSGDGPPLNGLFPARRLVCKTIARCT